MFRWQRKNATQEKVLVPQEKLGQSCGMKLPPLNAVKVFEATARTGSFVAAATELGVSAAAVSLQIRKLEGFLGKPLFIRGNAGIVMTDAGRLIYPQLARALEGISSATSRILDYDVRSKITLSTLQSVADRWLVPALVDFSAEHAGVGLEIRVDNDPVDFARERIDLRIAFGAHFYPGLPVVPLFHDEVTPLCAPALLSCLDPEAMLMDLDDARFLRIEWGGSYASYPTWADWFAAVGCNRQLDTRTGIRFAGAGIAAAAAVRGAGVMLGSCRLLAQEIAAGLLVAPFASALPMPHPYCAVLPPGTQDSRVQSRALRDLLAALTIGSVAPRGPA
jgi:LysR family glycine cleavage system transcriptional activator